MGSGLENNLAPRDAVVSKEIFRATNPVLHSEFPEAKSASEQRAIFLVQVDAGNQLFGF